MQHKADFSHPGDSDFDNEEADDEEAETEENKPYCKYGTACYRKNPLHKKHYRHTNPPTKLPVLPKKRKYTVLWKKHFPEKLFKIYLNA